MRINNRRYLGNKYKLLPFITQIVKNECQNIETVFDVFAGTGVVASAFIDKRIIVNDILYSNHLAHITWFSTQKVNCKKLKNIITSYNAIKDCSEDNYMSIHFSDTFFCRKVCSKIGYIRQDIEDKYISNELNDRERAILITSLLYALDKIANTCGHYDAYRQGVDYPDDFCMEMPEFYSGLSNKNQFYNTDSNLIAGQVDCDLAYLDPPYNSRQYCDAYHLLENIAKWEKPEVFGVAKKMDRTSLKSDYCTTKAVDAFEDLIMKLNCKYIMLSYNNTGKSANDRSNAKIKDSDIERILSKRGEVKVFSQSYKAFTTGKSDNPNNEERVFLCIVNDKKKDEKLIASPFNYTGGKYKLLSQILPLFPDNIDCFVDLFCGGLNVGINTPAKTHIYNDKVNVLVGLVETIRTVDTETFVSDLYKLINAYDLSLVSDKGYEYYGCNSSSGLGEYNKLNYIKLRTDFNKLKRKSVKYYEMFFLLIVYAFNNQIRFNNSGEFNLPVGKRDFNTKIKQKLIDFADRLKNQQCVLMCKDFRDFDISMLSTDSFVYADPPYLITTAAYNENGGWTDNDENALLMFLDTLNSNGIKFALSNVIEHKGRSNEILKKWIEANNYCVHYLNYNYKNSNYHIKDKGTKTIEVLVTNY